MACLKLFSQLEEFKPRSVFLQKLTTFLGCNQNSLSLQINNFWDPLIIGHPVSHRGQFCLVAANCVLMQYFQSICHWSSLWPKPPMVKGYVNLNCVNELSQNLWSPNVTQQNLQPGFQGSPDQSLILDSFRFFLGDAEWVVIPSLSLNSFILEMCD